MSYKRVCPVSLSSVNEADDGVLLSSSNLLSLIDDVLDKVINHGYVLDNSSSTFSLGYVHNVSLVKGDNAHKTKEISEHVPKQRKQRAQQEQQQEVKVVPIGADT